MTDPADREVELVIQPRADRDEPRWTALVSEAEVWSALEYVALIDAADRWRLLGDLLDRGSTPADADDAARLALGLFALRVLLGQCVLDGGPVAGIGLAEADGLGTPLDRLDRLLWVTDGLVAAGCA